MKKFAIFVVVSAVVMFMAACGGKTEKTYRTTRRKKHKDFVKKCLQFKALFAIITKRECSAHRNRWQFL